MGMFLAAMVGGLVYLVGILIMLSFGVVPSRIVLVVVFILMGVGGGLGGFLGWMSLDGEWRENLLTFGLALAGAFVGAAVGLQLGHKVQMSVKAALSITGIWELAGIIEGAVVGANVLPLLHLLYRRFRHSRFGE